MYVMDFKEYIVQRIKEMPLVTLATEKKDGAVCIDFTKVCEKMYNGVLIGNAANAAKILTECRGPLQAMLLTAKRSNTV